MCAYGNILPLHDRLVAAWETDTIGALVELRNDHANRPSGDHGLAPWPRDRCEDDDLRADRQRGLMLHALPESGSPVHIRRSWNIPCAHQRWVKAHQQFDLRLDLALDTTSQIPAKSTTYSSLTSCDFSSMCLLKQVMRV